MSTSTKTDPVTPMGCLFIFLAVPIVFVLRSASVFCVWKWFAWRVVASAPPLPFVAAIALLVVVGAIRPSAVGAADMEAVRNESARNTYTKTVGRLIAPVLTIALGLALDAILKAFGT